VSDDPAIADDADRLEEALGSLPRDFETIRSEEDRWQVATYAKLGLALVEGRGSIVKDVNGDAYLDLYGGHAVALAGHCHPRIVEAIRAQAGRLLFYSNVVYSDVRAEAVKRLTALAPEGLRKAFLCNSGTEANETALKIARMHTGRRRVVSTTEGFHGRTLGSLSATGLRAYHHPTYPVATNEHTYVPYGDIEAARAAIGEDVAAVILEPIPSMGGVRVASDAYFQAVREACTAAGAFLIFDEVQTGFGRTGTNFFGEHVGVTPDLITGAKGIAGGFPAGVAFVRESIAENIKPGEHGTTFGGGPLASAAIAATAAIIVDEDLPANAARMGAAMRAALEDVPGVESTAGMGLLIGVNLDRPAKPVCKALVEAGVLSGTCGGLPNQLRLLPPLTLTEDEALRWIPSLVRILGGNEIRP